MSENPLFNEIKTKIEIDPMISRYAVPGACRVWTDLAMRVVQGNYSNAIVNCEAREVTILDSLTHTFLQVEIEGELFYLDGSGVNTNSPYFGLASSAPDHLKENQPDVQLNTYSKI